MPLFRKRPGHILPFRIPFFRIFYSTTYTTIYIVCLCLLAITPVSMIWGAIQNSAYQYIIMIGGAYVFTALTALFIYSSRLYTNRSVLSGVGKSYIPVEEGEVGKSVRKMIVQQLERSAIIAWESRPRDLFGELLKAERAGLLPSPLSEMKEHTELNEYTVGSEIPIDPVYPPWGTVEQTGWSSPAQKEDGDMPPDVQFDGAIRELPNLIEARAVSLAPADESTAPPMADMVVVDVLRRPETMGMREYLTQLSYLGLVNPPEVGQSFLLQYERARFSGVSFTETEFKTLMSTFAELLAGMAELDDAMIEQIRLQTDDDKASAFEMEDITPELLRNDVHTPVSSSIVSPVTARTTAHSRSVTPYTQRQDSPSAESLGSVVHQPVDTLDNEQESEGRRPSAQYSASLESLRSETGSVLRHSPGSGENG